MNIKNYTEEQIEYIKNNYYTKTAKEIGEHIGKTPQQIAFVASQKLGLIKQPHFKWSDSDLSFLKEHYIDMTSEEISKYINHSVASINTQRDRLGLVRDLPWTDQDIDFLKNNYKFKTHEELGSLLNRTQQAITAKCFDLNLYKKEIPWTEKDYQYVRDNYMNMQTSEIADYLNRSPAAIKVKAKQMGLKKYPYCCDYHYFDEIDTEEKAYWLGFLSADGYISKGTNNDAGIVGVELQKGDLKHLKKLNKALDGNYKIAYRERPCSLSKFKDKLNGIYSLRIYSKLMYESLVRLGFTSEKSFDCDIPDLKQDLIRHYIRGYFDGNGCLSFTSKGFNAGIITASKSLFDSLYSILNDLNFQIYYKPRNSEFGTPIYYFTLRYKEDKIRFLKYMYDNCSIYLDRKYQKYLNVLSNYNQHESLAY